MRHPLTHRRGPAGPHSAQALFLTARLIHPTQAPALRPLKGSRPHGTPPKTRAVSFFERKFLYRPTSPASGCPATAPGRVTVVFDTTKPSTRSLRTTAAMSAFWASSRSGAIFTSSGGTLKTGSRPLAAHCAQGRESPSARRASNKLWRSCQEILFSKTSENFA
jgi:hypothetical protein